MSLKSWLSYSSPVSVPVFLFTLFFSSLSVAQSNQSEKNTVPGNASAFAAPGPLVERFGKVSGHTIGVIFTLMQDRDGFIWFGGPQALYRFDGYDLKRFEQEPDNPNGLPIGHIIAIEQDSQGFLWIATYGGGLARLDPKTLTFKRFLHDPANPQTISSDRMLSMIPSHDGKFWLGTNAGIDLFDPVNGMATRMNQQMEMVFKGKPMMVLAMMEDAEQYLWFAAGRSGLYRYHPQKKSYKHYRYKKDDPESLSGNAIKNILQDSAGDVWVATSKGVDRIVLQSGTVEHFSLTLKARNKLKSLNIRSMYEDSRKQLWVGSLYNGLARFNRKTNQFDEINQNADVRDAFDSLSATDIIEDSSGALWVSTVKQGLFKITNGAQNFRYLAGSRTQSVRNGALYQDSAGNIWFGSDGKFLRYDELAHKMVVKADVGGVVDQIAQNSKGRITFASYNRGLFHYWPETEVHEPVTAVEDKKIQAIAYDEHDTLWFSLMPRGRGEFGLYSLPQGADKPILHKARSAYNLIRNLGNGRLLIGGRQNGYIYNTRSDKWTELTHDNRALGVIWTAQKDAKGRMWVGTHEHGLGLLNLDDYSLTFISKKDGLPSNSVSSVIWDRQGRFWMGTTDGLAMHWPERGITRTIKNPQGLMLEAFDNIESSAITADGDIVMAEEAHVVRFSPERVAEQGGDDKPLPVFITDLKVLNESVEPGNTDGVELPVSITHTEHLTLSYLDYLFSLSFAGSDYNNQHTIRYAYKMEGLGDKWIEKSADEPVATFTSLPSGDYVFKVKASDVAGNFNDQYTSLKVTVTPPIWRTWQAYVIYVVAIILSIIGFYKYKTRALLRRAEELEQGVTERTKTINDLLEQKKKLFSSISHEFRTPLTLILSPIELLLKQPKPHPTKRQLNLIKRNGVRLLRMVEQLLEFAKLEQQDRPRNEIVSLASTLDIIVASFELIARDKGLKISMNPFEDAQLAVLPDSLNKILINLVSNACKYTPSGGNVWIEVSQQNDNVCVVIKDNGIGIDSKDHQSIFERFNRAVAGVESGESGSGIGLALVKELVEANGGTIALKSDKGQGAEFTVILPVDKSSSELALNSVTDTQQSIREHIEMDLSQMDDSELEEALDKTSDEPIAFGDDKKLVLVIDDNADMRTLLKEQLQDNYHVLLTENGKEGLNIARKHVPDLVISDIMMPVMDGYELTKLLKKDVLTSHIPVMLLSAKGSVESRIQGLQLLVDDYLPKPFHPDELFLRINNIVTIRDIVKKRFGQALDSNNPVKMVESLGLSKVDQEFMAKIESELEELYADPELVHGQLASALNISERQLQRKLKSVFDLSFSELVRNFRLGKAAKLLMDGKRSSAVCFEVGFASQSYFSKCFKARFGETPKNYRQSMVERPQVAED